MDPRMAQRRRNVQETQARRSLKRLMRVLGALAFIAAVVWAFRSPLLAVQNIDVAGSSQVDVRAVLTARGIHQGVAMMDVDLGSAVTALEGDPWIASATADRQWPQTITVEVTERVPVAWVSAADGWHHVAIDGVSLEQAAQPNLGESAIVFPAESAAEFPTDRDLLGLLEFVTELPPEYQAATSLTVTADASGATEYLAVVAGYQVRLGSGEQGAQKAMALMAVLETDLEPGSVITVIAPGQPAVLPPGAAESGESPDSTGENPEGG